MSRKPKKYHYIYKTTCKITGKFYVGMHSSDSLDDGYLGSGKILGYSRKKYGDENHVREILEMCSSRDELKQREKEIVNEALLVDPLNINLKYGGDGGGRIWSEEHRKKFFEAAAKSNNHAVRDYSANSKKAMATRIAAGKYLHTNSTRFLGKKMSKEHRLKISSALSSKRTGIQNPQYGKCWVTDGNLTISIRIEDLQEYLSRGFFRGRKTK